VIELLSGRILKQTF